MGSNEKPNALSLPLLPLRGLLAFPDMALYFDVGRARSIAALDHALADDKRIFLVAQRDVACDDPAVDDMYGVGTIAHVKHVMQMPDDTVRVFCEGERRALLLSVRQAGEYPVAELAEMPEGAGEEGLKTDAYMLRIKAMCRELFMERGRAPGELAQAIEGCDAPAALADLVAANALKRLGDKQTILECRDISARLEALVTILGREIELARIDRRIETQLSANMEKNQRDYYLREQIRVIQAELGESEEQEAENMRAQLAALTVTDAVRDKLTHEIDRFARMQKATPESTVAQGYIEWLLTMPWDKATAGKISLPRARRVLAADHYGLEKVKTRILEYLAVRSLTGSMRGPILCLVGPPGVGKTSIARSVARALGRKFVRMSLGGVHDEAEIRGHRRTYVGAIPGRIASSIKQADALDPVFLLDEIDKLTSDMRGDPAAALLEALDPEQNATFTDHYLDVPLDLSKVMFITTANNADAIPRPLLDRMELIEVPSYTLEEKVKIARRHLWPKQLSEHGLGKGEAKISERALRSVVEGYTREAGVRELERTLAALCRKAAMHKAEFGEVPALSVQSVGGYLGAPRYINGALEKRPEVGLVNGLAYTGVGGVTMPIEVAVMPGDGKLLLTGRLGTVMQESARIALSYIRSQSEPLLIAEEFYKTHDLHIHVPEGAVPKDGPSAGVALVCAMVSAITGRAARQNVTMTGEVTLRGRVLAIGGVKEKLLAAYRMGVYDALLPSENEKDLAELPSDVRDKLNIRLISHVSAALDAVLMPHKETLNAG